MFHLDNYYVSFAYGKNTHTLPNHPIPKERESTFVAIRDLNKPEQENILCLFWVTRYYKDQNNRNTARKFALDKALRHLFPGKENKELRNRFWKAYFEKLGDVKWKLLEKFIMI